MNSERRDKVEKTYSLAATLSELEAQILKDLAWHSTTSDAFTGAG